MDKYKIDRKGAVYGLVIFVVLWFDYPTDLDRYNPSWVGFGARFLLALSIAWFLRTEDERTSKAKSRPIGQKPFV